jgi:hypothetical protein
LKVCSKKEIDLCIQSENRILFQNKWLHHFLHCSNAGIPEKEDVGMKIKVKSEKIIKAVKKLYGVEIEVESTEDATEAIRLILTNISDGGLEAYKQLDDIKVTSFKHYETSAVDYHLTFLLEFVFEKEVALETRVAVIKDFQDFFGRL